MRFLFYTSLRVGFGFFGVYKEALNIVAFKVKIRDSTILNTFVNT